MSPRCDCGAGKRRPGQAWDDCSVEEYHAKHGTSSTTTRAGVMPVCNGKILTVQSLGNAYGPSKGGLEGGETEVDAACREFKEETGNLVTPEKLAACKRITTGKGGSKCTIFILELDDESEINSSLTDDIDSEITGMSWVCPECIHKLTNKNGRRGFVALNSVGKQVLQELNRLRITRFSVPASHQQRP